MDLDHPLWRTVEGRREMVRRTGTALVWMKTHRLRRNHHQVGNVLNVIDTIWERIQKLEVTVDTGLADQWTTLFRPAPHLESSSVLFDYESLKFEGQMASLFGGSAPMLRHLRLQCGRLNITAIPWFQQLRSLDISAKVPLSHTLGVLISTRNLIKLRLNYRWWDRGPFTLPLASLPKLKHLDLNIVDRLNMGSVLLAHIRIPPSCSVAFSASEIQRAEIDQWKVFGDMLDAIVSCTEHCFTHQRPRRLQVIITPTSFLLKAADHADELIFIFRLDLKRLHTFPSSAIAMFLISFSMSAFSKVSFFTFSIAGVSHQVPELALFVASLPSVKTLETVKMSLCYLRAFGLPKYSQPGPRVIFPALKTLRLSPITPSPELHCKFDKVRDPVSNFVMGRLTRGQSIDIVDFTEVSLDILPNMEFLLDADDVKVLWRQRGVSEVQEYICGTCLPHRIIAV